MLEFTIFFLTTRLWTEFSGHRLDLDWYSYFSLGLALCNVLRSPDLRSFYSYSYSSVSLPSHDKYEISLIFDLRYRLRTDLGTKIEKLFLYFS